jgi:hypothetical protein
MSLFHISITYFSYDLKIWLVVGFKYKNLILSIDTPSLDSVSVTNNQFSFPSENVSATELVTWKKVRSHSLHCHSNAAGLKAFTDILG